MKNKKFLSLLILPLLLLTSCDKNQKTSLIFGDVSTNTTIMINHSELSSKILDDESFIVVTTPLSNCACWSTFKNQVLNQYIEENHILVYEINYENFFAGSTNLDTFGINIMGDRQTFAIFNQGELVINMPYESDQRMFKELAAFKLFMEEHVNLPKIYQIDSLEDLNELYAQEEEFIIYYGRSLCGDCAYVDKYLVDYVSNHQEMDKIYYFDGELIRKYQDGTLINEEEWQSFKDNYGLSSLNNPIYGYDNGYVPTFYYVDPTSGETNGAKVQDGLVYFNDTIIEENGKYVVQNSYFSNERISSLHYLKNYQGEKVLEGKILSSEDVNIYENTIAWKQEKAAIYYNEYLKLFLDTYAYNLSENFLI